MDAPAWTRKLHRLTAGLFLLTIPPATYTSMQGDATSPFVYLPLIPLLALTLTGTYMLVRPWVRRARGGGSRGA